MDADLLLVHVFMCVLYSGLIPTPETDMIFIYPENTDLGLQWSVDSKPSCITSMLWHLFCSEGITPDKTHYAIP
jgi:hypothetical protein